MTVRADRRVMILAQLFDILKGLSIELTTGVITAGNFVHNRNDLPKEKVPGIILLDADEVKDSMLPELTGRNLRPGPSRMKMTPEVYIVLEVRKPQNEQVGEDLNTARAAILNKVLHDPNLQRIVGDNGSITYDGCVTDLARNRVMEGQMGLSITFTYPFIPDELKVV
jgi:hypothetical protein